MASGVEEEVQRAAAALAEAVRDRLPATRALGGDSDPLAAVAPGRPVPPRGRFQPLPALPVTARRAGEGWLEADLAAVAAGAVQPEELAARYRARATAQAALNAWITLCPPDHPQARPGVAGAGAWLRGAVIGVKDVIATAGLRTTMGSRRWVNYVPRQDAACWAALRSRGALCLGKTNTHEFAAGTTAENEHWGPVRNPWDRRRVAGGSSGGSAAAVAAGLCAGALGTDTAGSVRIPAACCGVVGFKPTYGRISCRGVLPLAWSLDHVGTLARTVWGAAALAWAMMGGPPPGCRGAAQTEAAVDLTGVRLGVPWAWLKEEGEQALASGGIGTAPEVAAVLEAVVARCRARGATVVGIALGSADMATAVNRLLALPESYAYHAPTLQRQPESVGPRVRARLLAGGLLPAHAYVQALRWQALLCRRYGAALRQPQGDLDAVLTPTLPTVAPRIGAGAEAALALLRFTAPFNVVGWPALSLPAGRGPGALPIGVQLAAPPGRDGQLVHLALRLERLLQGNPL